MVLEVRFDRYHFLQLSYHVYYQLTGGLGAHHIFDNVGINEIEKCFNCVTYGGTIHCIGFLGGKPKVYPDVPMLALIKGATVRLVLSFIIHSIASSW